MRLLLILCQIFVVIGCGRGFSKDYQLDENSFDINSLKMIEQRTGIKLPESSRGLRLFYQGSHIDPSFIAKIEIPISRREELIKVIEQYPIKMGMVKGSLTEKVDWWIPPGVTIQIDRQFTLDGNYVHMIFCKEKDQWILYIEWIKI